ncbi:MAG: C39 family peptidase [Melioribacteraceae bacterium]|nr:C39 family peptidase [Melioribacteraceae bacterium]
MKEEKKLSSDSIVLKGISRSIQLDRYSCAAQTVKSVLDYYGKHLTVPEIIRLLGTDSKEGTDTGPILNLLQELGFNYSVEENADLTKIRKYLAKGIPLLITVDDWEHWVLIYGISKKKIFLIDSHPLVFTSGISINDFVDRWDDNWICGIFAK